MKSIKMKKSIKWKIEIIVFELVVICALLGVLFVKKVETYDFYDNAIYYQNEIDYIIPSGSKAKTSRNSDEITIERKDDESLIAQGLPVYFENEQKIALMKDMIYVQPMTGAAIFGRLTYFTEAKIEDNDVLISKNTNSAYETTGFLFDGLNTYLFLEDVEVKGEGFDFVLPRFSYVIATKKNCLEYLNYNTKENAIIYTEENVTVKDLKGTYSLIVDSDILNAGSAQYMLQSNLTSYDLYFEVNEE